MRNINRLHRASAETLQPGELFIYSFGGVRGDLVLKLFDNENGESIYGILDSPLFSAPLTWCSGNITGACLTFGADWLLEPVLGPETHAGSKFHTDPAHRLFLDKDDSFVLRFQSSSNGFRRTLDYAIGDRKERQLDTTAAPIAVFRLWADEADYLNPRALSIFEYPKAR